MPSLIAMAINVVAKPFAIAGHVGVDGRERAAVTAAAARE
jgi:hypothetical protein